MGGVSNAAQAGGAVQTIPGWGGSHPMCWSCRDGLQHFCCFLVALVSRADPTLRNTEGGFLWLCVGLRLTPTLWGHLKASHGPVPLLLG